MSSERLRLADRGPGWSYRPDDAPATVYGEHQPGITTPRLDHLALFAFDLDGDLGDVLRAWSAAAEEAMAAGGGDVTVGLGLGPDAFAGARLAARRPVALRELPAFAGDALEPGLCGGDLLVMACAREAAGAVAAADLLRAAAAGAVVPRWSQEGFVHREHGRGPARDLLGFRDGTMNLRRGRDLDRHVWVGSGDRDWMAGGSYLVVRRIRILLGEWEALSRGEQEAVVGKQRESGAPLGRRREFDPVPLEALGRDGRPLIPLDAHARMATPRSNAGAALLRRSYSYDNGRDAATGARDAGLMFMAFQRDPRRQFVPVQERLAAGDALSRFTRHVGSAVFAIPPGARQGGFVGDGLFA
jgi:deferrochelatase/peroxidase EfeB